MPRPIISSSPRDNSTDVSTSTYKSQSDDSYTQEPQDIVSSPSAKNLEITRNNISSQDQDQVVQSSLGHTLPVTNSCEGNVNEDLDVNSRKKEECVSVVAPAAGQDDMNEPSECAKKTGQPIDPFKLLSFPAKLHAMLSQKEYKDYISWMPHGRSWRIHKPEAFEMYVIPNFFIQCKLSSFIRQANGWGFRRITKGTDRNSYYHKYFLRGRLSLCHKMFRHKKKPSDKQDQPDFYRMSQLDPLPEVEDIIRPEEAIKKAPEEQNSFDDKYSVSKDHDSINSDDLMREPKGKKKEDEYKVFSEAQGEYETHKTQGI